MGCNTTSCCRGVALVTVLFILFLLTTLSVYMIDDQYLSIRRIANQRDSEQTFQMAVGAEQWAAKILERDMRDNETDHLEEPWNELLPAVPVEEGTLATEVVDAQGLFNLNNLQAGRDKVWYPAFVRLLRVLELEEGLADAVVDWIDADVDVTGSFGAEDGEYLSKDPPYRAANRLFAEVGELQWVEGFELQAVTVLAPFVSALPATNVRINVNTAVLPVLQILGETALSEPEAQALIEARGEEGFSDTQDFLVLPELAGQGNIAGPLITISSEYFNVRSRALFGRVNLILDSVIYRRPSDQIAVVLRRRRSLS